ncbi:hypothetical protein WBG06_25675 [Nocardioides sp. CCNWLW239]|uniref:WXG100-like domain-containing protein n=1 Tax=Nocardioides sp. CCNWLW239 TaxID=3128902 RepID=UPI003017272B
MRIDVQGSGYDSATEALLSANSAAASAYQTLTGKLGGYTALGGDDTSSEEFVKSYDESAIEAVNAFAALVDGLGALAVAADESGRNHRRANAASVYNKPQPSVNEDAKEPQTAPAFTPPSSLGGDNADMPDWWNHIVDHLQGWGWPSANTDQLRSAADAWKSAASAVRGLVDELSMASTHLEAQRSPEITIALGVIRRTKSDIEDLADGLEGLGDACRDYGSQVDETRETIKGLLRDLAIEVGVTAGISAGLSFFTFGGAAVVGGGVIAARAIRYAKLVLAALRGLRAARAVGQIASKASKIARVRLAFEKLKKARRIVQTFKQGQRGKTIGRGALNAKQSKNLKRFEKKLPKDAEETIVKQLNNGDVVYTSKVPGRVPGSYAEYTKIVDEAGDTVSYVKTTYAPDGKIVHIKEKM